MPRHTTDEHAGHAAVYAIEAHLEKLIAAMGATRDAVQLKGAEAKPLTGTNQRVTSASTRLMGFAIHEPSTTAPADVTIRNGDGGEVVMVVSLSADESAREWFGPGGISVGGGVSLEVAGAVEGSLFVMGD